MKKTEFKNPKLSFIDNNLSDVIEQRLKLQHPDTQYSSKDIEKILTELSVYQEELLAQNRELQEKEHENIKLNEQINSMFHVLPAGVILLDKKDNQIKMANPKSIDYLQLGYTGKSETFLTARLPIQFKVRAIDYLHWFNDSRNNEGFEIQDKQDESLWYQLNKSDFDSDTILIVITDISAQKKLQADIAQKTRDAMHATEANEAKSQFLANMSHEIRTPMNGVMGMLNKALKMDLDDDVRKTILKADMAAGCLMTVINDILDFSKIEAGKLDMEAVDFRLEDVMDRVHNINYLKAEEKSIAISFNCRPELPKALIGDPLRLGQILLNLTSNALKFTSENGTIEKGCELLDDKDNLVKLKFYVKDSGIGMSHEQVLNLFKPFTQADSSTTREYGGTGLGLTISKKLVEMMNGEIWAESELGKGTTFYFTIEMQKQTGTPSPRLAEQKIANQANGAKKEQIKGAHLLVVEDYALNQEIVGDLLSELEITYATADNGEMAIAKLNQEPFDGVLMDCQMPIMDGYEATRQIRKQAVYKKLPIIALTAHAMKSEIDKCARAGMDDHLSKPVFENQLIDILHKWVKPQVVQNKNARLLQLYGLDSQWVLDKYGNKLDVYPNMLLAFNRSLINLKDSISKAGIEETKPDPDKLKIQSLKIQSSAAANVGYQDLQQQLERFILASQQQSEQYQEIKNQLLSEIDKISQSITENVDD